MHDANHPVSRSGRFGSRPAEEAAEFSESVSFDWRLWQVDIAGSMAHADMLQQCGILTVEERDAITSGLEEIGVEIREGRFQWRRDLEDVHMNIEAELTRRVPAGAKLHTGRSRNDQVAVDTRLWLREEIVELCRELESLQHALLRLGGANVEVILPGYTHLQRAQPVYFAHHLLAYVEMLQRDKERLSDALGRVNQCPLGSGALAGSTLPLDREMAARELGFTDDEGRPQITRNSMDAVSDRDYVVEFCAAAALIAIHLSRLAEDLILWASREFQFITMADRYTTGSSLMPQKKNPDLAELTRGKSGRVVGNLVSLLVLLKGLPMTYNRDLQEDKERLFDTTDTVRACARIMAPLVDSIMVNHEQCRAAASDSALLATDLAEYLVQKGVPFREAHHLVGAVVGTAEKENLPLHRLTLDQLRQISPHFDAGALEVFDVHRSLAARNTPGAPNPDRLRRELNAWPHRLREFTLPWRPPA